MIAARILLGLNVFFCFFVLKGMKCHIRGSCRRVVRVEGGSHPEFHVWLVFRQQTHFDLASGNIVVLAKLNVEFFFQY